MKILKKVIIAIIFLFLTFGLFVFGFFHWVSSNKVYVEKWIEDKTDINIKYDSLNLELKGNTFIVNSYNLQISYKENWHFSAQKLNFDIIWLNLLYPTSNIGNEINIHKPMFVYRKITLPVKLGINPSQISYFAANKYQLLLPYKPWKNVNIFAGYVANQAQSSHVWEVKNIDINATDKDKFSGHGNFLIAKKSWQTEALSYKFNFDVEYGLFDIPDNAKLDIHQLNPVLLTKISPYLTDIRLPETNFIFSSAINWQFPKKITVKTNLYFQNILWESDNNTLPNNLYANLLYDSEQPANKSNNSTQLKFQNIGTIINDQTNEILTDLVIYLHKSSAIEVHSSKINTRILNQIIKPYLNSATSSASSKNKLSAKHQTKNTKQLKEIVNFIDSFLVTDFKMYATIEDSFKVKSLDFNLDKIVFNLDKKLIVNSKDHVSKMRIIRTKDNFYIIKPFKFTVNGIKIKSLESMSLNDKIDAKLNIYSPQLKNIVTILPYEFIDTELTDWIELAEYKTEQVEANISITNNDSDNTVVKLNGHVKNAYLKFMPEFPPLNKFNMSFSYENNLTTLHTKTIDIANSKVHDVSVIIGKSLEFIDNKFTALSIKGKVNSDINGIKKYLLNSPLDKPLEILNEFNLSSKQAVGSLEMFIPLSPTEEPVTTREIRVHSEFPVVNGLFQYKNINIDGIEGVINVERNNTQQTSLQFDFTNNFNFIDELNGSTTWNGELLIEDIGDISFVIDSELQGIASNFPNPFKKSVEEKSDFNINGKYNENSGLFFSMQVNDEKLNASLTTKTENNSQGEQLQEIEFGAKLSHLSIDEWLEFMNTSETNNSYTSVKKASISVAETIFYGHKLKLLETEINSDENSSYLIKFNGENLRGNLNYNTEKHKLLGDIYKIHVENIPVEVDTFDTKDSNLTDLASYDGTNNYDVLPEIDLNIKDLLIGATQMENINIVGVRNNASEFNADISMNYKSAIIKSTINQSKDNNLTTYKIFATAKDIADLMEATQGKEEYLTGKNFDAKIELQQHAPILGLDMYKLLGTIDITVKDGEIIQADPGDGAKFFALFNLSQILRILSFDASDITSDGLTYSEITIKSKLKDGVLYLDPAILTSTITGVKVNDTIDLKNKQFNLDVLILPEIEKSIPLIAFLTGIASPINALGLYLLQNITNATIIKFRYKITGDLDKPVIKSK